MEVKAVEIRDDGTFIPALAIQLGDMNEAERYLAGRAGFVGDSCLGWPYVILIPLESLSGTTYSCTRGSRTYDTIHQFLATHFDEVRSGQVLDVEYILGEVSAPKQSEAK